MPKFLMKHLYGYPQMVMFISFLFFVFVLSWYSLYWGLFGFLIWVLATYFIYRRQLVLRADIEKYMSTLDQRIKKAGEEVILDLPIGIVLYDETRHIQWVNPFFSQLVKEEGSVIDKPITKVIPNLEKWLAAEKESGTIRYRQHVLEVISRPQERMLYVQDKSDYHQLLSKYEQDQVAFLSIHLDNLDDVTQGLDEQSQALLISDVSRAMNHWSQEMGILLRRSSSDKFFGVMHEYTLRQLEDNRFSILDTIRELTKDNRLPVTLSIGVGAGSDDLQEISRYTQSSLDVALARGGDQAAVKRGSADVAFYGGKSDAVEKRTKVRARVIAHALRDLIIESDHVLIMGHQNPDMDALGASIGVLKAVQANRREGFIVMDDQGDTPGIDKAMERIKEDENLMQYFISSAYAEELFTRKSLLIIVDSHKPSMIMAPRLAEQMTRKVVIDHHRRGEEFISDPLLVYMEPYASSTCELVTELLEYQSGAIQLSRLEATAMLAGIVVDTKNFALRTGSRTFEAASYLRQHGADTRIVQNLLKEDIDQFVKRARIVEEAEIYRDHVAISVAEMDERYGQVLMAQAADTLLTLDKVMAAFVLSERKDGVITISARSMGELNVQMMMEKMEGGGHLTNAATQLDGQTIDEALQWLKEVIDESLEGGNQS